MMTDRFPALLVLALALGFALSPLFSDGFNGFTPQQFPVVEQRWPVQPAGWAFSIWGLIYAWLIAGAGFGLWRRARDPEWQAMRGPLAASLLIGCFWIAVANRQPVIATAMILAMLAGALAAFLRSGTNDVWWQRRPVALYAGWLTAASGVATAVVAGGYGLVSSQMAAMIALVAVLALALWVQARRPQEWAYPLAVGWALTGVIAANLAPANAPVLALAGLGILALTGQYIWRGRA